MSKELVPFDENEEMWTLAPDRRTIRLSVPAVHLPGLLEPIRVLLDFDADGVDDILRRLIVLRARMPEPAEAKIGDDIRREDQPQ